MCNLYDFGAKSGAAEVVAEMERMIQEVVEGMEKDYVAPGKPGVVMHAGGRVGVASWGFRRAIQGVNKVVNNSRIEKLERGMWKPFWERSRCVIPLRRYFEAGPKGSGVRYSVTAPDGGWIYAAGVWEMHPELGVCYSMITRKAEGEICEIHHRMPAFLERGAVEGYLAAERGTMELLPVYEHEFTIDPKPGEEPGQLELDGFA